MTEFLTNATTGNGLGDRLRSNLGLTPPQQPMSPASQQRTQYTSAAAAQASATFQANVSPPEKLPDHLLAPLFDQQTDEAVPKQGTCDLWSWRWWWSIGDGRLDSSRGPKTGSKGRRWQH